ncbi:MAG: hypothetical protein NTV51_13200 [Verrucomicrobia bacterium]|nr:hypothetical protein [Verrucomicrobiota bacterium]
MNSQTTEQFRICLLQALREVAGDELPAATLVRGAKLAGFKDADDRLVAAEMSYLVDKGMAAIADKTLSPENREWRITASGRDYLASRGL